MSDADCEIGKPRAILLQTECGDWLSLHEGGEASFKDCTFGRQRPIDVIWHILKPALLDVLRHPFGGRRRQS
ncbi:hypothetical protein VH570_14445 [Sphingobium sp. HT1-2]|uniref:hypothetical protein n=1 Tax=Sphingobium sp. HT1-2 TaxID=3111640 RepID=UPI003C0C3FBB